MSQMLECGTALAEGTQHQGMVPGISKQLFIHTFPETLPNLFQVVQDRLL